MPRVSVLSRTEFAESLLSEPLWGLSGAGRAGASSDSLGRPGPVGASESWGPLGEESLGPGPVVAVN